MSSREQGGDAITVMLVPGGTGTVRRFTIPRSWLRRALYGACGAAVLIAAAATDYVWVRSEVGELDSLRAEAAEQRAQLAEYSERIEQISGRLTELGTFERKLRIIASLDPGDAAALPGVGGIEGDVLAGTQLTGLTRAQRHRGMIASLDALSNTAGDQQKSLEGLVTHLEQQSARLSATPSIAPARGWITSDFGYRTSPFTGRREFHRGLDIAAREGTPILAPGEGRVRFAGEDRVLGRAVILRHGFGVETFFGHLSELSVKNGQLVKRGDRIGLMGSSGRSTGPHLHYQVDVNGTPVNPQNYILD